MKTYAEYGLHIFKLKIALDIYNTPLSTALMLAPSHFLVVVYRLLELATGQLDRFRANGVIRVTIEHCEFV